MLSDIEQITQFKRGKVIMFNMEIERDGSQIDAEMVSTTFQGMNAEVENCKNYSKSEIKKKMDKVKITDFSNYDYLVIILGAHGSEDAIVQTANQEYIYLHRALLVPMCRNKTLSDKLKWIITQTCRGSLELEGVFSFLGDEFYDPKYYLISYSTTEGFVSRRSPKYGSIFIRSLCEEIEAHCKYSDILTIMKRVSDMVELRVNSIADVNQKPSNEDNFGDTFSFSFCS